MAEGPLLGLGIILVVGVAASWLASRLHIPSILPLLVAGFIVGPVTGWIEPDALFGDLLLPIVSFSVAIILFEGGLTLRVVELREIGRVVRNLVTLGVLTTWAIASAAAYLLLGLNLDLSLLLGAILVVTGPTVIIPLMRHLRPKGDVGNVLKWEGILIDPIGVILAVLVFEAILAGGFGELTTTLALTVGKALLIGGLLGVIGALFTYTLLKRHWVPDVLHNPVTLAVVGAVFVGAELVQAEAGLVSATVMGVVLANQGDIAKRHILEFKETLSILLISFLFIVLAARLELTDLSVVSWASVAFLAILFIVARPLSVWLSTMGSELGWRDRAFMAAMAPRGIVAAAISSVFALEMAALNHPQADLLVPLTFLVIIGTVTLYSLAASPLGRLLDIADPNPQGVLIVGAHPWARDLAGELKDAGVKVRLVDSNRGNLQEAWDRGLNTQHGNTLNEAILEELDLEGIGNLLALTPNDEVNALTVLNFLELFDRAHVFQLAPGRGGKIGPDRVAQDLRGRILFGPDLTYSLITELMDDGWQITSQPVEAQGKVGPEAEGPPDPSEEIVRHPLVVVRQDGSVQPVTAGTRPPVEAGDTVISLTPPDDG